MEACTIHILRHPSERLRCTLDGFTRLRSQLSSGVGSIFLTDAGGNRPDFVNWINRCNSFRARFAREFEITRLAMACWNSSSSSTKQRPSGVIHRSRKRSVIIEVLAVLERSLETGLIMSQ